MLGTGRVPGLFEKEDYEGIFSNLRNAAKAAGVPDSPTHMFDFFISRVKQYYTFHCVFRLLEIGFAFAQDGSQV